MITAELLIIEVNINNKVFILSAISRPPNQSKLKFLKELKHMLSKFQNKNCIVIGDLNIDVNTLNRVTSRYLNIMADKGLKEMIKNNTRTILRNDKLVTSKIDHIFIKTRKGKSYGGVLDWNIANHNPIWVEHNWHTKKHEIKQKQLFKKLNNFNINKELKDINWDPYFESDNVEIIYTKIIEKYNEIVEKILVL